MADTSNTAKTLKSAETLHTVEAGHSKIIVEAIERLDTAEALNTAELADSTKSVVEAGETLHALETLDSAESAKADTGAVEAAKSAETTKTIKTFEVKSSALLVTKLGHTLLSSGAVGAVLSEILLNNSLATMSVWLMTISMGLSRSISGRAPVGGVAAAISVTDGLHVATMAVASISEATTVATSELSHTVEALAIAACAAITAHLLCGFIADVGEAAATLNLMSGVPSIDSTMAEVDSLSLPKAKAMTKVPTGSHSCGENGSDRELHY